MPFTPTVPTTCPTCGLHFLAARPASTRPPTKYCSLSCAARGKHNTVADFWARVQKGDGCWLWTGCRQKFGYGSMHMAGRPILSHRRSWELTYGAIPPGMSVLHRCDNPPCCRPDHLFLGTQGDNNRDMFAKNRRTKPTEHHGEAHGMAKLKETDIPVIRARVAAGERHGIIGRDYGITRSAVTNIAARRVWKHVP